MEKGQTTKEQRKTSWSSTGSEPLYLLNYQGAGEDIVVQHWSPHLKNQGGGDSGKEELRSRIVGLIRFESGSLVRLLFSPAVVQRSFAQ